MFLAPSACVLCVCPAAGWVCVVGSAGVAAFGGEASRLRAALTTGAVLYKLQLAL